MKTNLTIRLALCLILASTIPAVAAQTKKASSSAPRIEIASCNIDVNLTPDAHEFKAAATVAFKVVDSADYVVFDLNENITVLKVTNAEGVEYDFGQGEIGPGSLSVRYPKTLSAGANVTMRFEFQGGFDRDRFSRLYSRDPNSAYIGMEGTYLLYSAKWFPISQFLTDRAPSTITVTVPLGMTAIGPGIQMPVVTKGITETFGWSAKTPILPGSFVAGQYFQKDVKIGDISLECFARENQLDSMQKIAEAAAKILEYYRQIYGPSASGNNYRLVEVDDQISMQHGMLGTIFVTHRELERSTPPIRELARRIAYQWWQESVGVKQTGDLWLVDGMSYLSAANYIGKTDGPTAFKEEIDNLAVLALKFESKSSVRSGVSLGYETEKYESVVAGKGAWVLNMLRAIMTDSKFERLTRQYFHDYAGSGGTTSAFQKLAESAYGKDLNWFFVEWLDTIGVPEFQTDYAVFKTPTGFRISGTVKQDKDLFRMPIEIAAITAGREEKKTIDLNGKSTSFDIASVSMPERIVLDPGSNLLRNSKELQTSVQLTLGNELKDKGEFVEAIRAYEGAIKLSPHRSIAHFRMAETFFEQFNLQSAANSFRDALNGDRDPKWIEVWCYIYLGKIYDILGQRQRAMAEYTKAVNTKDDTFGAQAEANKWLAAPFTKERTTIESEKK
jgi:aminopeptidase N